METTTAKYYVPTIEEFHVGFEFEIYKDLCDGHYDWYESTFGLLFLKSNGGQITTNLAFVDKYIKDDIIRVKHLDQTDIEECGFNMSKTSTGELLPETCSIFKSDLENVRGDKVSMFFNSANQHVMIWGGKNDTMFAGTIRNKSELKRIMTMLNINPESK